MPDFLVPISTDSAAAVGLAVEALRVSGIETVSHASADLFRDAASEPLASVTAEVEADSAGAAEGVVREIVADSNAVGPAIAAEPKPPVEQSDVPRKGGWQQLPRP